VRLDPDDSKNKEGRLIFIHDESKEALQQAKKRSKEPGIALKAAVRKRKADEEVGRQVSS